MKILFVERDVEYIDPMNVMLLSALGRPGGHPYPGCELTEYAIKNGFFDGDFDKLFFS